MSFLEGSVYFGLGFGKHSPGRHVFVLSVVLLLHVSPGPLMEGAGLI